MFLAARNPQNGQNAVQDLVKQLGSDVQNRLTCVEMDVGDDMSVRNAAKQLEGTQLYGIVNNAGVSACVFFCPSTLCPPNNQSCVCSHHQQQQQQHSTSTTQIGWDYDVTEIVNTNYFGPRRVNDAFARNLQRPGGRIVNIASASGPNYVSSLPDSDPNKDLLTKPWKIPGGIAQLDELARSFKSGEGYGISKALLNAYTVLHGKSEKELIINSCSPGYILTDMTAGRGASASPSKGAVCPCFLLMDESLAEEPSGRYYGSDCVRSPLDVYRGPGDPPYVSDDDLVELSFEASK